MQTHRGEIKNPYSFSYQHFKFNLIQKKIHSYDSTVWSTSLATLYLREYLLFQVLTRHQKQRNQQSTTPLTGLIYGLSIMN